MSTPLVYHPLKNLFDALAVRRLRNSGCQYLTNYQQVIGLWQQIHWYFQYYRRNFRSGDYRIFIFRDPQRQPVGYGALQLHDNRLYITECLETAYRGKGYGTQILQALIKIGRQERRDLVAEIWSTNQASLALHVKSGFELVTRREHNAKEILVYHLRVTT